MLTIESAGAALLFCVGLAVLVLVSVGTMLFVRSKPVSHVESRVEALSTEVEALRGQVRRALNSAAGRASRRAAAEAAEEPEQEEEEDLSPDQQRARVRQEWIKSKLAGNGG